MGVKEAGLELACLFIASVQLSSKKVLEVKTMAAATSEYLNECHRAMTDAGKSYRVPARPLKPQYSPLSLPTESRKRPSSVSSKLEKCRSQAQQRRMTQKGLLQASRVHAACNLFVKIRFFARPARSNGRAGEPVAVSRGGDKSDGYQDCA